LVRNYQVPNSPPLESSKKIVQILDSFTELTTELTTELIARKKQYSYYRDKFLTFKDNEVEWKRLGEVLVRTKGTKITAGKMKELHRDNAPLNICRWETVAFVIMRIFLKKFFLRTAIL